VGFLLADPGGHVIYQKNADLPFVPASTLKVLTSLTALDLLGADFHFKTDFFLDHDGNLKIKGWGDPLLTSREIQAMATRLGNILKSEKIFKLRGLVMDGFAFEKDIVIPGTTTTLNPYDATVGALCANFNTISFKTRDSGEKKDRNPSAHPKMPNGRWLSAEPETPLTDFARDILDKRAGSLTKGRIPLPRGTEAHYAGHLLAWFLEREGIETGRTVTTGAVTARDPLLFTWISPHDVKQVVSQLLYYSNNFMANQLFLGLGLIKKGAPANLSKAVNVVMDHASTLGIAPLFMEEGSGISRQNRISPRAMLKVLQAFKPHHDMMRHSHGTYYKTGTLKGVRTLCGYFTGRGEKLYPFVIMVNQDGMTCDEIRTKLQAKAAVWDEGH
jgi:D-alanyl-D-alanine carboxypeptidase/D-alanyl-D-alanine-endopeptidase (penicillin-binding protein 4)